MEYAAIGNGRRRSANIYEALQFYEVLGRASIVRITPSRSLQD